MSDLIPKKERHLWYWLQGVTIFISLLAVIASIYAAIKAKEASVSTTILTSRLSKDNELESRIYQQRYDLYKEVWNAFTDFNANIENKWTLERAKILRTKLKKIWYGIRTIWTPYIICRYSNILSAIDSYVDFVEKESPAHAYTDYWRDVIPAIFLFEKSIRETILQENSVEMILIQWNSTAWFYDFNSDCHPWLENWILEDQYR